MLTIYRVVLADRLPVLAEDRLVVMNPLARNGTHIDVPFAYLPEIGRDSAVFRGAAGTYHKGAEPRPFTFGNTAIHLATSYASGNFFDVLSARPAIGRFFTSDDARTGAARVIVIGYSAWRRSFGSDSSVVGRQIVMPYSHDRATIIGVAPPGIEFPIGTDVWIPQTENLEQLQVDIVARLAPGVTVVTARNALLTLVMRHNPFAADTPTLTLEQYAVAGIEARPFADFVLGTSRPVVVALTLAVGILLLIACINVGGLVLVRLLGRAREIAIRRAIGASYGDVVRLFAIENLILAAAGGVLGTATAIALIRLTAVFAPSQLARRDALALASPPLGTATLLAFGALLVFGFAPSLIASRIPSLSVLRSGSRTGSDRSSRRARRVLVATQMALAVVLLAGAGLLVRSLAALTSMDLGYRPEYLSVLQFSSPKFTGATGPQLFATAHDIVAQLEATPGVVAATSIESLPFKGTSLFIMRLAQDDQGTKREDAPWVPWEFVSPNYFRTLGIPIKRGRPFRSDDTRGSAKVVIVNENLAERFWPRQDPIGKRLVQTINGSTWTVIGVARDTRFRELKETGPVAYFDWDQASPFWNGIVAVRTTQPLGAMLPALRAATRAADPTLAVWWSQTMDQLLDTPMTQPRLSAALLSGFSLAALLLSAIGLYGVLASTVRQQTREIGVRIALGATASDLRRLVFGDALQVVVIGALVGVAGALATGRLLSTQLFGVAPADPAAIGFAAGLLIFIGACAAYAPARRATRIDPVEALRSE